MPLGDDLLNQWENIISEVAKTEVPLECIKKVVIKLEGRKQKTINLSALRKQSLSYSEIETILNRALSELADDITDIDFVVDVLAVAELVQPETDKLLNNIK